MSNAVSVAETVDFEHFEKFREIPHRSNSVSVSGVQTQTDRTWIVFLEMVLSEKMSMHVERRVGPKVCRLFFLRKKSFKRMSKFFVLKSGTCPTPCRSPGLSTLTFGKWPCMSNAVSVPGTADFEISRNEIESHTCMWKISKLTPNPRNRHLEISIRRGTGSFT